MKNTTQKLNYIIDILLLVCFFVTAISGILFLSIPKGPKTGWYQIGGWYKTDLRDFHAIFGILMIVFGVIHFLLHLSWIVAMTRHFFKFSKKEKEV